MTTSNYYEYTLLVLWYGTSVHFKDAPKLLALILESEAGVHGQEPVVFLCFFIHSRPT